MKSEQIKPNKLSRFGLIFLIGLSAISARAATRYVDVNNTTPNPPYLSWATAATKIQDAVNVALAGDEVVVTNGVYSTGGTFVSFGSGTNRVAVTKALRVRSVRGAEFTIIDGLGEMRCVYLTNGASLTGFTLTHGVTGYGGGIYCQSSDTTVLNCVLTSNAAYYGGGI